MKALIEQIENKGLEVTHYNKHNLWVKSKNAIVMLDAYKLFGLEEDDLMLTIKQTFYQCNIKIDIHNPDNNKSESKEIKSDEDKEKKEKYESLYLTVDEKKKKIRDLLTNKYKLI